MISCWGTFVTSSTKSEIRKTAHQTRDQIQNRNSKSARIRAKLLAHPEFQSAQSVLIYISIRSEVDTRPLIDQLLNDQSKRVYVPYCDGDQLGVFPLENWDQLETHSFGLLEPKSALLDSVDQDKPLSIDLTVVPGVAFDDSLNRLGYGKGYYDRLLSQTLPQTYRLAIAFEDQILKSIPTDKYDIPMHEVMTECGRR